MPSSTWVTSYGYRTVVAPPFTPADARAWFEDVRRAIGPPHAFGQLVDLRGHRSSSQEPGPVIAAAMQWVREQGMQRSAVVVRSVITELTVVHLARAAGVLPWERYFDAAIDPQWEARALAWIEDGLDPDA